MSGVIELTVHGDVGSCREAARRARGTATAVTAAVNDLGRARTDSSSWTGAAAETFRQRVEGLRADLVEVGARLDTVHQAVDTFADELSAVRSSMADVRDHAAGHGLTVAGDEVLAPVTPPDGADAATVEAHNTKVEHWDTAVQMAREVRVRELRAHEQVTSAVAEANGDGWLENLLEKLGVAPPDGMDGVTGPGWLAGLGLTAFGVQADAMARAVLGRWQPWFRGPAGWRLGSPYGHSAWQRFRLGLRVGDTAARDWRANPYQSVARGRWQTAGKWAGRAGLTITAVTAGWQQWQADSDDPSLDTGERVDRSVTSGVSTAAGAWAGAKGGAWVGGAIGTAICPGVGTVVGGAIGGLVGGVGGAMVGDEIGDFVNEQWDGAVHAIGDGLSEVGDGLSEVGDTITFWD